MPSVWFGCRRVTRDALRAPLTLIFHGSFSAYREDGQGEADHKPWRASAAVLSSEPFACGKASPPNPRLLR